MLRFCLGIVGLSSALVSIASAQPREGATTNKSTDEAFDKALAALVDPNGLTIAQTSKRAMAISPEVLRKQAEVEGAILASKKAELVKIPRIGASATYTRLSEITPPELSPGVRFPVFFNNYNASAQIGVPLSDYLVRVPAILKAAKLGLEAAKASEDSTKLTAAAQAVQVYYEWVKARVQTVVVTRSLDQIDATLATVRALFEVQRVSKADLLRVESQRALLLQTIGQLELLATLREEQLRMAIGATSQEKITIGEDFRIDVSVPTEKDVDALLAKAMGQRLDVHTIDVGVAAKTKQMTAEKAGKLPRLSAFAQLEVANPNQRIFPLNDEFRTTWSAGVQLSWSFNDFLATKYTVDGIDAENRQLLADRRRLASGIKLEILAARQALEVALLGVKTAEQTLVFSEEAYRVRSELLASGRATTSEVIDAQTELTRARGSALTARIDLRSAIAQLTHAIGDDKPTLSK